MRSWLSEIGDDSFKVRRRHGLDTGPRVGSMDILSTPVERFDALPGYEFEGQPHQMIRNGGHFLQEDAGETIADTMLAWMR